ncbi:phosphorylase [Cupriavidus basilensis]|uniref:phosphorylase n=1 Tax=Cupriavidus basilensis TaxID=68895 RepID=UPI003D33C331
MPQGRGAAPALVVTGMGFEARIAAGAGVETLHGHRAEALAQALRQRLARPCAGVVSFGVAGGLDPALSPGRVIVATGVCDGGIRLPVDASWSQALCLALPEALSGVLAGTDGAVTSIAGKAALHAASGALAVDMESHIAARVAQEYGLPFAACRVVIDPAGRQVPPAAVAAMGADGSTDMWALLKGLLAGPWQVPDLIRLGRDARVARTALERVRGKLGVGFGLP